MRMVMAFAMRTMYALAETTQLTIMATEHQMIVKDVLIRKLISIAIGEFGTMVVQIAEEVPRMLSIPMEVQEEVYV